MELKKAVLEPADSSEHASRIEFMFNPTQLQLSRSVSWSSDGARDENLLPKTNFSKVEPFKLSLSNIIFDTYETGGSVKEKYIKNFHEAVSASSRGNESSKDKRPPIYNFCWGSESNFFFRCVVESVTIAYTMFLPDGTPVRAQVSLNLREVDKVVPAPDPKAKVTGQTRAKDTKKSRTPPPHL